MKSELEHLDILFLLETWKSDHTTLNINDNFTEYSICRHSLKTAKRNSGGIIALINNRINDSITLVKSHSEGIMWFKLSKEKSENQEDLFICCVYISPQGSSRHALNDDDLYDVLYDDILLYNSLGICCIYGDFNARTGSLADHVDIDTDDFIGFNTINIDISNVAPRLSQDKVINQYGRQLINICMANELIIVNGRTAGDEKGEFTCYTPNGRSLVDYMLCSKSYINYVNLSVRDITPLSDHCMIYSQISINNTSIHEQPTYPITTDCSNQHTTFKWNPKHKDAFIDNITACETKQQIQVLNNTLKSTTPSIATDHINKSISDLTHIILDASHTCAKTSTHANMSQSSQHTTESRWHDIECKQLLELFKQAKQKLKRNKNAYTLQLISDVRNKYTKCCRIKKAIHDRKTTEKHVHLKYTDSKLFWRSVKPFKLHSYSIDTETFYNYFLNINSHTVHTQLQNDIDLQYEKYIECLDEDFTFYEIECNIKGLKHNKSPGYDNILNECLIYGRGTLLETILLIFQHLYNSSYYPEKWSEGIIIPIYKKGDKMLPENYRAITLLSCIGKLYTSTIYKRIAQWATDNRVFSEAQFGFRQSYSTIDAIYTLYTQIIRVKKTRRVYCAFIDFSTAFDTVNREVLTTRLMDCGISSKMLKCIISIYTNVTSCVKTDNVCSSMFLCKQGLRQGDSLSPLLFSLYINDIKTCISANCTTFDKIDMLMFADDLIIMSETRQGLQIKLDKLYDYCKARYMSVNISKSKIVVFHSSKNTVPFTYNSHVLEEVSEFKYLGFIINRDVKLVHTQNTLISQALIAQANLDIYLRKHKHLPVKVVFELFDTLVKTRLLYGCDIWGCDICKDIELFHLRFIKKILGVKGSTNTCLLYMETGRYPLYIEIYKRVIKYWLKITTSEDHQYIHRVSVSRNTTWFVFVKKMLFKHGYGYVWDTHAMHIDHGHFITEFEQRLKDQYMQLCMSIIQNSNRCILYNSLNRDHSMAEYLLNVHIAGNRKALAKLRLSAHKLYVERGRWLSIPREDRICSLCCILEDEYHVIVVCPRYKVIRQLYIKPYYSRRPSMFKFAQLLNTNNIKDQQKLAVCVKKIFALHKDTI